MSWRAFIGRNVPQLRLIVNEAELGAGGNSHGLFSWAKKNVVELSEINPTGNILLRSFQAVRPTITATYAQQEVESVDVTDMSSEQVEKVVRDLVLAGESKARSTVRSHFRNTRPSHDISDV